MNAEYFIADVYEHADYRSGVGGKANGKEWSICLLDGVFHWSVAKHAVSIGEGIATDISAARQRVASLLR